MGSAASKTQSKVFTPESPIDFSASFLSQLESSQESDYSRSQYTEKYIQDRVQQELTKLEKEALIKFQQTTNDALLRDAKPDDLSVPVSNEKISHLKQLMQKNLDLTKVEVSPSVQDARSKVVSCLRDNKGKTLNCWEEVEAFKALVKDL